MKQSSTYHYIDFFLIAIIVVSINIISSAYFIQWDLTEEKRYTLTEPTKTILRKTEGEIFLEIYLSGDLPPGFDRLKKAVKDMLDAFSVYSGARINYVFVDPHEGKTEAEKARYFSKLAQKGIQPTNLYASENGKQTEKLLFPGAIINYKGYELPVQLLKGNSGASPTEVLNQSVEGLEYTLIASLRKLKTTEQRRIGFTEGHNELSNIEVDDLARSLKDLYSVERINLASVANLHAYFDVIIIAKPQKPFTEQEKIRLDQFVMQGGRLMIFMDKNIIDVAALTSGSTIASPYDTNLDDLLFRYGVRVNANLLQDLQCAALPMVVGKMGDKPQTQLMPWLYYPVVTNYSNHVAVKNAAALLSKYVSTLDTVSAQGIQKTILMYSSQYSALTATPATLQLDAARKQIQPEQFKLAGLPLAVLLEGNFKSLYTNRLPEETKREISFKEKSLATKIMVFGDGDILRNEVSVDQTQVYPLGYDTYLKKQFGNKEVLLNCIEYLLDDGGVIQARNREVKLRPLDKQKIKKERTFWQVFTIVMPLVLLAFFSIVVLFYRRYKYAS